MSVVNAFWYKGENNFGDILTPYLIDKIAHKRTRFCHPRKAVDKIVTAGSIISDNIDRAIIWGTGASHAKAIISPKIKAYHAVRGPITARMVKEQRGVDVKVVGDPGILLRRFYDKPIPHSSERKYIGLAPHYVDYQEIKDMGLDESVFKIINLKAGIQHFLDEVVQCRKVFSSSLHGIIGSHSMRTPCQWVKFSDKVLGDGTKFLDYFGSIGQNSVTLDDCIDLRAKDNQARIEVFEGYDPKPMEVPDKMLDDLLHVCPFK